MIRLCKLLSILSLQRFDKGIISCRLGKVNSSNEKNKDANKLHKKGDERVNEEKSDKVRYFMIGISIILNSVGVIANSIAIIMRLYQ